MAARKRKPRTPTATEEHTHLTDEGLLLVFMDAASRHCIASYASMMARREPELAQHLINMVEEAGGLDSTDLDAATAPKEESNAKQG